jgi:hypothetical protein
MSFNLNEGSYIYRGDAFGVSARFDHPNKDTVPTQAQAVLAPTGGEAYSSVKNFNHRDAVVFDEAMARVVGSKDPDGSYHTDVTSSVRNLRFLQVHADIINMRITSVHRVRSTSRVMPEADIGFAGCSIKGLVIAGHVIEVDLDDEPSKAPTFVGYRKAYPKRGFVYESGGVKEHIIHDTLVKSISGVQRLSKDEANALVKDPNATLAGLRYYRNVVLVPEFGKIFIGELLIERGLRRVNMLRIELGCGTGGGGSAGGGGGDGGDIPPESPF